MKAFWSSIVGLVLCIQSAAAIRVNSHQDEVSGWRRLLNDEREALGLHHGSYLERPSYPDIIAAEFRQPLDHFSGLSSPNVTFQQRYWYSTRNYKPPQQRKLGVPAPVIVLEGGETSGEGRLSYLDHGILEILTKATGGVGVVLEHRYYGKSVPERSSLGPGNTWSVDELRWLTNSQAEADSARFVQHMQFEGIQEDLTSRNTPVIVYGGSYAGARAAHLRVLYPGHFWGAIASSAVTAAIEEFPQYMNGIARGNDVNAIQSLQAAIQGLDAIIAPESHKGRYIRHKPPSREQLALLTLANLQGLSDLADFADLMQAPLGDYQSVNWDDTLSPQTWAGFLDSMARSPEDACFRSLKAQAENLRLQDLPEESLRLIHWLRTNYIDPCRNNGNRSADECFGSEDWTHFVENEKLTSGRAWSFQVCTTWGYFITSPPRVVALDPATSPQDFMPSGPKLISSLLDLEHTSKVCREGFPPGKHMKIPSRPDVAAVNKLGNFALAADRLMFVDGQFDPWREATPHSETFAYGGARSDTLNRPFILIANATHHWDENGLSEQSRQLGFKIPEYIQSTHERMIESVKSWIDTWVEEHQNAKIQFETAADSLGYEQPENAERSA